MGMTEYDNVRIPEGIRQIRDTMDHENRSFIQPKPFGRFQVLGPGAHIHIAPHCGRWSYACQLRQDRGVI